MNFANRLYLCEEYTFCLMGCDTVSSEQVWIFHTIL